MRVAVISDLHLGAADRADEFGHDDGEFDGFLARLERGFERVVLLGDVWETLTGARWNHPLAALTAARAAHPLLARRFARPSFHYVHGNHDLCAGSTGAPEHLLLEADGTRVLFAHGHQSDALVQRARWFSEVGVWLGGWVRRVGLAGAYRWLRAIDRHRELASDSGATQQRWAVAAGRSTRADVVVTGHTHVAGRVDVGGTVLINSGSCSEGAHSFVALDTRRGEFSVHLGR